MVPTVFWGKLIARGGKSSLLEISHGLDPVTDQRPRPNEKKTGARYRKITDFARRKKGKEENSFHRKRLCLLTCLLMGDPFGTL